MRLRRTGARKQPRYRVVIAEARTPRDGAFVDILGFYDPLTEPATVRIDQDRARDWIQKGAQPSDAVERILRRAGIELRQPAVTAVPEDQDEPDPE
ncbi:MAG TPA: 30S ribosomal protein S16 [Rhodothermia bacterium]|nr:30S ribosomal protein S16 [Rhodothermia bacterium]